MPTPPWNRSRNEWRRLPACEVAGILHHVPNRTLIPRTMLTPNYMFTEVGASVFFQRDLRPLASRFRARDGRGFAEIDF